MKVVTPDETAKPTRTKYLGVLVAARYARELNALPSDTVPTAGQKKLTTRSLEALVRGDLEFDLTKRRRRGT